MTDYENHTSKKTTSDGTATLYRYKGILHRLDGPAVDTSSNPGWYLMGIKMTEGEHREAALGGDAE